MRMHTDTLTLDDLRDAARLARVEMEFTTHGSRKRKRAFDVKLTGESRRRPNGGNIGAGTGYAATWDQWGVFLGHLFECDPSMVTPYYENAGDFHYRTAYRFEDEWPADAHGDHRFEYVGVPYSQSCKKCSAVTRWQ